MKKTTTNTVTLTDTDDGENKKYTLTKSDSDDAIKVEVIDENAAHLSSRTRTIKLNKEVVMELAILYGIKIDDPVDFGGLFTNDPLLRKQKVDTTE